MLEPPTLVSQPSLLKVEMILQILYLLLIEYLPSNMNFFGEGRSLLPPQVCEV